MKILYFDCFSGAAGDMILGALLDAGLPFEALERALGSLAIDGWGIRAERVLRAGVQATKFHVDEHTAADAGDHAVAAGDDRQQTDQAPAPGHSHSPARQHEPSHSHVHDHAHSHDPQHDHAHQHGQGHSHTHGEGDTHAHPHAHSHTHGHHTVGEIKAAIDRSNLSVSGKARAKALFDTLAEAESAIHGMSVDEVHLHEVGAIDSIVDVVGAVFALEWFGADRIVVSPMNVGGGMVRSAHGLFPVPAPATLRLLGDAPVYSSGIQKELLTPTGALLLTSYASSYGPVPAMRIQGVGYGAGDRDLPETPNVLRVLVGEADAAAEVMRVSVIECEIDDMNPQLFGPLMDRLLAAGALDVFYTAIQMKKNRPATLVTVITLPARRREATDILFRESTTIGLRHQEIDRECLARTLVAVATPLGDVRFKVARQGARILNAQPEFDDLARIAGEQSLAIKDVQAIALKAWLDRSAESA